MCGAIATPTEQFLLKQALLELELMQPNKSILKLAAARGHRDVLAVLAPHGVHRLVHRSPITVMLPSAGMQAIVRYNHALASLDHTVAAVAPLADAIFRRLHDSVLSDVGNKRIAVDAPSRYTPPENSCARGSHVPSVQTKCKKCRKRRACESLDPFAFAFANMRRQGISGLTWANCDARKWATPGCHIEFAKLFCPRLGDDDNAMSLTDFYQLDATGLFNMLSWCTAVDAKYRGKDGAAQGAARARNLVKHKERKMLSRADYIEADAGLRNLLVLVANEPDSDVARGALESIEGLNSIWASQMGLFSEAVRVLKYGRLPHDPDSLSELISGPNAMSCGEDCWAQLHVDF